MQELDLSEADHKIPFRDLKRWGKYDLNVWTDFGEDGLGENYSPIPGPNAVYWCSDSHLGLDYRLDKAKEADYVFVTIKEHIPLFKQAVGHNRVYWLPHAGEPTCYNKVNVVKRYDVCFIGHLPNQERIDLLDSLFKAVPDFWYGQRFFEAANDVYCESKLVFNHCISKEANMRVFEGTLSGSAVLCTYSPEIKKLGYKDGKNIIFYKDKEEMIEKALYYLENEEEREAIGEAGRQHTLNNHTYLHRIKTILEIVGGENGT